MKTLARVTRANEMMAAQLYAFSLGLEMLCKMTRRAASCFVEPVTPVDEAGMQIEVWKEIARQATLRADAQNAIQSMHD